MKPMTIEQLKALEIGDWVWIKTPSGATSYYKKADSICDTAFVAVGGKTGLYQQYSDYGKTWLAYKNKEQAEAKGDIVDLPCKVGDTVFVLRSGAGSPLRIEEEKIIGFDILQNTVMAHGKYGHAYSEVFSTKIEAEARLKELQE